MKRKTVKSLDLSSQNKQEVETPAAHLGTPRVRSQYQRQVNNFLRRQYQNKQSLRQTVRCDSAWLPIKASQYGRPRRQFTTFDDTC